MSHIRCACCNRPVKTDDVGKLRLAIPGNHDSTEPTETAICPGSEQLGTVEDSIWVRVGDAGEYESFDSIADTLDYLNELKVGKVTRWRLFGFNTPNYWGHDYISIFRGTLDAPYRLTADDIDALESGLIKIHN